MSSGRKSMAAIICEGSPQNNAEVREFLLREGFRAVLAATAQGHDFAMRGRVVVLSAAELTAALRCAARRSAWAAGTLILVTEDQPALLQIVGRHLDRHPIARQRLDAVLLHLAGRVGDNFMSGIELHAVARVGQDFGHQSFELDQLFFSHGSLQVDRRLVLGSLVAVGFGIRAAFAMQKGNALHPVSLYSVSLAALRRTRRLMAVRLRRAMITTTTAAAARPFWGTR